MRDYHQEMTNGLINALEQGVAPWQKPWDPDAGISIPYNPTTNKPYRGGNVLWLMCESAFRGYDDPRWMTYKQTEEQGWHVQRGEHGTCIAYWKRTETRQQIDPETGEKVKVEAQLERPVPFFAIVFNARQIAGVPALERKEITWNPVERAEAILQGSGARISHDGGSRAFYRPATDDIHLPARAAFPDAGTYYDTALHELGHWTGYDTRLNRTFGKVFGSPDYAREELRAEIASFFTSAEIGLPHNTENHAAYVQHWVKALKDDKYEIFRAARDAEQISDYLLAREIKREMQADQVAELKGTYGEKVEVRALLDEDLYGWVPATVVDVVHKDGVTTDYVVQLDGVSDQEMYPASDVRPAVPSRDELIQAAPFAGTVRAGHIEQPKENFVVAVLRAPSYNVIYRPERWEVWRVQAETPEGATQVAHYHFPWGQDFEYLGKEIQRDQQPVVSWKSALTGNSIAVCKDRFSEQGVYGRIDFLSPDGTVSESLYYNDKQSFDKEVAESANCGRPIISQIYENNSESKSRPASIEDILAQERAMAACWDRGDDR